MQKYYQKTLATIYKELNTDIKGLDLPEVNRRLSKNGKNIIKEVKKKPLILKFLAQFNDIMAIILIVAGILAYFVSEPRDGIVIFTIVIINSIIGFIQEYRAERIMDAFSKHLPSYTRVIRNREEVQILASNVVPGDILVIGAGDKIAADARLIEAYRFKVNSFSLTGESVPQTKQAINIKKDVGIIDMDNMIFMGTNAVDGEAKAVVIATGMQTHFGTIAQRSQEIKEELTPLQKELVHTGKMVAKIALGITSVTLIIMIVLGKEIHNSVLFAIAAGLAMVPEGLPAAMSVALSLGAERMLKKNALIKRLVHVETLGSVTTICTDKTGTITKGIMTVSSVYNPTNNDLLFQNMILCNNAHLGKENTGDPLEIALLEHCQNNNIDQAKIAKEYHHILELPFSSERKMMSKIYEYNHENVIFSKGAPNIIIDKCRLSAREKENILSINDKYAKKGLRVLAFAYRNTKNNINISDKNTDKFENDLIFLGLVALIDPVREGVAEAISLCRQSKIKIHMITGDYGLTALAISKMAGLANNNTKVITGEQLAKMDDNTISKILDVETVFARIEPEQKLRIVKVLQDKREVVAVTGDGVNDAPALVKADIGVAMGKIGTDVAKEASDMILMDDHFATIVNAIREGRRIFDNAKKFVYYVFSSNSGELFTPMIGLFTGLPLPLTGIQILAIDLGTDVFPSLALGVENEEKNIMKQPPRTGNDRIMDFNKLINLLQVGLVMAALALTIFLVTLYKGGWHWGEALDENNILYYRATASVYATLVFCQAANALSCRSNTRSIFQIGLFSNIWLIYAEIISAIMLAAMMWWPPIQHAFKTAAPSAFSWILIFLSFFIFLAWAELRKKLHKKRH